MASPAPGTSWKQKLADRMNGDWSREIDIYEGQLFLKRDGKIEDKVFAETRLRRGSYGQRYDNGQRHDGQSTKTLAYDRAALLKGPETVWDAPGMTRIKIPYGGMSPDQLDALADLAEEYSDGILHVTTRQDIQLHFVHIEDTPDLMRRLASVDITTREACGNSVRNITGCPRAGVCHTEAFDISPYAEAMMRFLLGHPDVQDFGRKFKPAFSGCEHEACGLVQLHDSGYVAKVVDGKRGFKVVVGGGLGAVPHQAAVLSEFTPVEELLPQTQAVARVFARLGEKKNRNKARIKFLVSKLGIEEFRRLVEEERKTLPHDPRWTDYLKGIDQRESKPIKAGVKLTVGASGAQTPEYEAWAATNLYGQRQDGYAMAVINCPLGDITSEQARAISTIARRYVGDNIRTTVEQNIVLRYIPEADLSAVYGELAAIGLGDPGAGTIVDITACPGTDTCKLGIAASRGLAGELRQRLTAKYAGLPEAIKDLKIKISGCFNSCGQHHVADIGFYGNSRKHDNRTVPHFQVVLGGQWDQNAGSYGLAVGSVPSKAIPDVIDALAGRYLAERSDGERFKAYIERMGKKGVRGMIEPFMAIPAYAERPEFYTDWGDPREFTIGDMGMGECAGEIVSVFSMEIAKAESLAFDASVELDEGKLEVAEDLAYRAMVKAAEAIVRVIDLNVTREADDVVARFRERLMDTELFFDKYMKGKFGQFLLDRHADGPGRIDKDRVHHRVEEAQLFIEAAHACESRLTAASATPASAV